MNLALVSAVALLVSGCQLLSQRDVPTPARTLASVPLAAGSKASFVILPKVGEGEERRYEIRSASPGRHLHDWPIEAEIRAFSRLSAKNGGPTYSLLPEPAPAAATLDPKECIVDPELRRVLKSKKPVCYTTEDAGTITVYTLAK